MGWEWICLIVFGIILVGGIGYSIYDHAFAKKYLKYFTILLPLIAVIIIRVILESKGKKATPEQSQKVKDDLVKIADKLHEINTVAEIESIAIKSKNTEKMDELKEVQNMTDERARRKRLAEMLDE